MYNYYIPRVGTVLITLELIKELCIHEKAIAFMYPPPPNFLALFSGKAVVKMPIL